MSHFELISGSVEESYLYSNAQVLLVTGGWDGQDLGVIDNDGFSSTEVKTTQGKCVFKELTKFGQTIYVISKDPKDLNIIMLNLRLMM